MKTIKTIGEILDSVSVTHKFGKDKLIFLNTSDVLEGKILTNQYLEIKKLKGQAKKTICCDDILFSEIRPKNKRFAYVDIKDTSDYVVSTKLMVLRNISSDVLTKYVYYYLTYKGTLDYLQMRAENRICSFPQITFDILKTLPLNIPSIITQNKIVSVISCLDEKIQINTETNNLLESLSKLIYDYWFVQFDFPDKNGNPYKSNGGKMSWSNELNRNIPEGWRVGNLSDMTEITMGQSPPGTSYNEKGMGKLFFQGSTDFGIRYPVARQYTTQPTRHAKSGDLLLSVRAPVGTINIANQDCCIGRGLASLRSKNNTPVYLYQVMQYFKQVFDQINNTGTTFGAITKDDLFNLKVLLPPNETLALFEEYTRASYDRQNYIESENLELLELRDWLLPMLMNGQIHVID